MAEKKTPEKSDTFLCIICQTNSRDKKDYNRHISTRKHKNRVLVNNKLTKITENSVLKTFNCNNCQKKYTSRVGLWKHKKICAVDLDAQNLVLTETKNIITPELIMSVLEQNKELQNLVAEQTKHIIELSKNNSVTNNGTVNVNSHNKTFNLNLFLNEYCKDAMNIMDFVDSLKLELSDLEHIGKVGYVEGITNIIVKNLKALDVHKRPVHCSDAKREIMYIKDENIWQRENEDKQRLRKAIKYVAHKNCKLIPEFKEKHPDCGKSTSKFSDQYNKLVIEAMGGFGDNEVEKENKIIRNIAKEMVIDKTIMF